MDLYDKISVFNKIAEELDDDEEDRITQKNFSDKDARRSTQMIPPKSENPEDIGEYDTIMQKPLDRPDFSTKLFSEFQIFELCEKIKSCLSHKSEEDVEIIKGKLLDLVRECNV